jgi:drug/metabolite transporter (DMT)-like permease
VTVAGVLLACLASCLFNAAIVVQAREAREQPAALGLRMGLLAALARRRRWLAGAALSVLALATQTGALLLAPVTVVQPADAAGLLLLLYLGSRTLGERVGPREVAAVVAIVVGVAVLTAAAPRREVTHPDASDVLLPLLVVAAIAIAPIVLRRFLRGSDLAVVIAAGFAFALSAFAIKLVADAFDRAAWAGLAIAVAIAVAGGVMGTLTEQSALQQRAATTVAPVIFVVELLVPIVLAVTVVGESWSRGYVPILAALTLIVVGVITLSRTRQVAGLLTPESGP